MLPSEDSLDTCAFLKTLTSFLRNDLYKEVLTKSKICDLLSRSYWALIGDGTSKGARKRARLFLVDLAVGLPVGESEVDKERMFKSFSLERIRYAYTAEY